MSTNICPVCHTLHDTTACPSITVSYHEVAGKLQNDYLAAQAWEIDIRADERQRVLAELREKVQVRRKSCPDNPPGCAEAYGYQWVLLEITALLGEQKGEEHGNEG